jgi:hypothetical protein
VALVADQIEARYKQTVILTLVTGIANLTNWTMSRANGEEKVGEKQFTIARSLSQVSNLIRGDPEIISNKEKDELREVISTLVGIEDFNIDNGRDLGSTEVYINQTKKLDSILTSQVMVKDQGMKLEKVVNRLNS